jgi:hypothetical protein
MGTDGEITLSKSDRSLDKREDAQDYSLAGGKYRAKRAETVGHPGFITVASGSWSFEWDVWTAAVGFAAKAGDFKRGWVSLLSILSSPNPPIGQNASQRLGRAGEAAFSRMGARADIRQMPTKDLK